MLWVETTNARFSIERAPKRARQVSPQPAFVEADGDNEDLGAAQGADSGGSRPRIRDDVAHHSDLISLGVPG
jgi:hypothetical protein